MNHPPAASVFIHAQHTMFDALYCGQIGWRRSDSLAILAWEIAIELLVVGSAVMGQILQQDGNMLEDVFALWYDYLNYTLTNMFSGFVMMMGELCG